MLGLRVMTGVVVMASSKITPVKIQSDTYEVNQLQSNMINAITALSNQLVNTPASGQFITNRNLQSGDNELSHTLGVLPVGMLVVDQDAAANFFTVNKTTNTITVNASAPVMVSLFIF